MEIHRLVLGPLATNSYLLTEGNKALLIDPASKAEKLFPELEGYELLAVLLTHGHFDHIKAVDGLYKAYHMPVYLHPLDEALARDRQSGAMFGLVSFISCPTLPLKEGKMEIGPFSFEVLHTPGHTEGSVCFLFDGHLFSGDTLFHYSVGRTDLPGGSWKKLKDSLRIFQSLPEDLILHPGHEEESVLRDEFLGNPFLN